MPCQTALSEWERLLAIPESEEGLTCLLQKNVLNRRRWSIREQLRLVIVTWIEARYHRKRRQRGFGKLTPIEYGAMIGPQAAIAAWTKESSKPSTVPTALVDPSDLPSVDTTTAWPATVDLAAKRLPIKTVNPAVDDPGPTPVASSPADDASDCQLLGGVRRILVRVHLGIAIGLEPKTEI